MATATQTHVTDPLAQTQESNGALVHNTNQNQDMVHNNRRHSVVSTQTRPQSGVFAPADQEEHKPGQKKTQKFLPWYTRWGYNISLGAAQTFLRPASMIRDTQDAIRSTMHQPNMIRHYECRKLLPVR